MRLGGYPKMKSEGGPFSGKRRREYSERWTFGEYGMDWIPVFVKDNVPGPHLDQYLRYLLLAAIHPLLDD